VQVYEGATNDLVEQRVAGLDLRTFAEAAGSCPLAVGLVGARRRLRPRLGPADMLVGQLAADRELPTGMALQRQAVRHGRPVPLVGRVAEVEHRAPGVPVGTIVGEGDRPTAPAGRVERPTLAWMHAANDEHVGEIGAVVQPEGELDRLPGVVLNRQGLGVIVAQMLFAADAERFLAHPELARPFEEVRVGQLEQRAVALAGVGQQGDGRQPVEPQGFGAEIAHVVEVQALVGVGLDVAVVGAQQKQAALLDHRRLDEPRPQRRALAVQDPLGAGALGQFVALPPGVIGRAGHSRTPRGEVHRPPG
jgi:hypothetical protein